MAVPAVGAVVNGGLKKNMVRPENVRTSATGYRLRFLTEKYKLDRTDWAPDIVDAESHISSPCR